MEIKALKTLDGLGSQMDHSCRNSLHGHHGLPHQGDQEDRALYLEVDTPIKEDRQVEEVFLVEDTQQEEDTVVLQEAVTQMLVFLGANIQVEESKVAHQEEDKPLELLEEDFQMAEDSLVGVYLEDSLVAVNLEDNTIVVLTLAQNPPGTRHLERSTDILEVRAAFLVIPILLRPLHSGEVVLVLI